MNALEMTDEQLDTLELTHKYGGPELLFIRDLGPGEGDCNDMMCQVGIVNPKSSLISQVFMVRKNLLRETGVRARNAIPPEIIPPMMIKENTPEDRALVSELRAKLESGEVVIDRQFVKKANAA